LRDGVTFRIVRGRFLQNLMQQLPVIFGQFIEAAPARLVRWNWIVPAPCATGVLIEVFAWIYGLIHRTQVERLGTRDRVGRRGGNFLGGADGGRKHGGCQMGGASTLW